MNRSNSIVTIITVMIFLACADSAFSFDCGSAAIVAPPKNGGAQFIFTARPIVLAKFE